MHFAANSGRASREHERAIKPYGLEVSKTSRKGGRDSLGLSLILS